jgi:hypothetical protein
MIVPPAGCYKLLLKRLGDVNSLSLRKRMCLAYLAWKLYGKRHDQETLVDTANEFRIKSLTGWSNDNGFCFSRMHATANRPWKVPHYKGYKARHYNEELDSHVPWAEGYEPKPWNE